MKEKLITIRNRIIKFLYKNFLKRIFFALDPEFTHDMLTFFGRILGSNFITRSITNLMFGYSNKMLEQKILGIDFKNPIGLAAGFDKDALLTQIIPEVGFGFEEIGSVTGEPCEGNPKPRLWRLKKSQGLVIYYGLKNDGAEKISQRLKNKKFKFPIGVSIAKTNCKETVEVKAGIADYVKAYRAFEDIGDYYTINISCPNAFGGEPFTDCIKLEALLEEIDKHRNKKPIFIKIGPDLTKEEIDKIIEIAKKHKLDGFVCTNLTKKRDNPKILDDFVPEKGSISGRVMTDLSDKMIAYLYEKTKGKFIIIGVGGIFTAEDAYRKIKLGASLLQMITGMIFEGPQTISEINQGLTKLLKKDGYKNISKAVGETKATR